MDTDPTLPNQGDESSQVVPLDRPENIFDESDEFSVVNLVSPRLREAILAVPKELFDLTEGELRAKCSPTQLEYQLRVSFWREFENVFSRNRKGISSREVFGGICSEGHFYRFLENPSKVAWLVRPIEAYDKQVEAISLRMLERIWEIAEMDLKGKDGSISPKKADLYLRAYDKIAARKRMMVGKVIKPPKQLPAPSPKPVTSPPQVIPNSLKEINDRIAQLEKEKRARAVGTIDVPAKPAPQSDGEVEVF